ncbi:IQCJ-SCHIP1 readthrough transcript protein-like isoform X2 [Ptychodera flava]|uniref:IQCJ-SCHIP1 readthrough transcript protein-like isoform X2 n=1 Tax=Ptychodera flava TaxID=63121 RepID=UPI003969DCFE
MVLGYDEDILHIRADCFVSRQLDLYLVDNLSKEEKAAICIQCHFRGYLGRKKYLELLYEQFNQEEEMRMQRTLKQVEEGELLVENHKLEVEFDDNTSIRRNRSRYYITKVITIQRAWRAYLLNKANRDNLLSCEEADQEDDDEDESPLETDESSQSEMSDTESTAQESNTVSASNSSDMLSVKSREDESEGANSREEYVQALSTMHDLESSVELDDAEFARLQQAIEDKKNKNINNLSLAEEFANIDVVNPEVAASTEIQSEYESDGRFDGASASQDKMSGRQSRMDRYDSATESEERSEVEENENIVEKEETESLEKGNTESDELRDHENNTMDDSDRTEKSGNSEQIRTECSEEKSSDLSHKQTEEKSPTTPPEGTFDVYNLEETTLPVMDWASLEAHLANISKEEQSARESQRSNREEILRKLAMAGEDDEIEGDIYGKGKDKLSTRLQGGMNLQICFVNDSLSDSEVNEEDGDSPRSPVTYNKENDAVTPKSPSKETKVEIKEPEEEEDFAVKQARLQEEARLALAQARPMARMQIEVEKQQRKKSPVAELAGAAGLTEITEGLSGKRMLRKQTLVTMTVSQIKTIVNDLRSQIENLNEELMQQLIVRDELQMEQDSKLVDIEDLSRWINMNMQMTREKERNQPKQQRLENRNKRQYDTLLSLLSNTLPVSRKCMCGVSRSSSMSSRSISSPESQKSINSPQESIRSLTSPTDSSSTSHISSPELTWVRQAIVKYWYT